MAVAHSENLSVDSVMGTMCRAIDDVSRCVSIDNSNLEILHTLKIRSIKKNISIIVNILKKKNNLKLI